MSFVNHPSYIKKIWLFFYKAGFYSGCHQIPERSFRVLDMQFPICARCTGVFVGEVLSILLIRSKIILNIKLGLIFLFIMFFDWFIQYVKLKKSNNYRRFITGFLCGIGLMQIYYQIYLLIIKSFLTSLR